MTALRPLRRLAAAVVLPPLVPWVARWIGRQEARILRDGEPLPPGLLAYARDRLGVRAAAEVRVLVVEEVPLPVPPWARRLGGFSAPRSPAGLAALRGIYVRPPWRRDRGVLAHELAHVAQYERLGGARAFLRVYLRECMVEGYPFSPLELEAGAAGTEAEEWFAQR